MPPENVRMMLLKVAGADIPYRSKCAIPLISLVVGYHNVVPSVLQDLYLPFIIQRRYAAVDLPVPSVDHEEHTLPGSFLLQELAKLPFISVSIHVYVGLLCVSQTDAAPLRHADALLSSVIAGRPTDPELQMEYKKYHSLANGPTEFKRAMLALLKLAVPKAMAPPHVGDDQPRIVVFVFEYIPRITSIKLCTAVHLDSSTMVT